jgi:hypothetical protein
VLDLDASHVLSAVHPAVVLVKKEHRGTTEEVSGSALGDANQHFLTAIQRDLLTSVESRGS